MVLVYPASVGALQFVFGSIGLRLARVTVSDM